MKKYNTRPIDFTGCHPVVAEHLKRGEEIECKVWSDKEDHKNKFVFRYRAGLTRPYETDDWFYEHAEPIPIKTRRTMPPERAIPILIAEGWVFGDSGDLVGHGNSVVTLMFKMMGKPLSDPEVSGWAWPPCIIEEVEDDE